MWEILLVKADYKGLIEIFVNIIIIPRDNTQIIITYEDFISQKYWRAIEVEICQKLFWGEIRKMILVVVVSSTYLSQ